MLGAAAAGIPSENKADNCPKTIFESSFVLRVLWRASRLRFWGHVGPKLGPCWPHVGPNSPQQPLRTANLGPSWGHRGPTWGHLGPSWANLDLFEANLEPTWGQHGPLGALWGATWGQLGANLASFCQLRPTGGELETDVRQANHRTAASTVRNHLSKSLFETSTGQMRKGPWPTNSWISTATDERSIDR